VLAGGETAHRGNRARHGSRTPGGIHRAVTEPTDADLVRRCTGGDERALELLHARHATALLRFLERLLHDHARAEDVCQEAFLRIWRRAELYDSARGTFSAWLYRAAANLALNRLALRSSSESELSALPILPAADVETPVEEASVGERQRLLHGALGGLSPRDRAILTLRHIEERPVAEIAEILDIPEGTVKSRVHYAMHRLRAALEPAFGEKAIPGATAEPDSD
jgi:RNA polymerase sigma-70 factor (ECF subfamily)